jgi:hypothetical protein
MKTKASLIPNINHEIRKQKQKQKHDKLKQRSNKILFQKINRTRI